MSTNRRQFMLQGAAAAASLMSINSFAKAQQSVQTGLAEVFRQDFQIGTALSNKTLVENDSALLSIVAREFNAITTENALKWSEIHPEPGVWNFAPVDNFVEFGRAHNMQMVGHTLMWHRQTPAQLFSETIQQVDHCNSCHSYQKATSKKALLSALETHTTTVLDRYKKDIYTWDVANEVFEDDGQWRESEWYKIIGSNMLEYAFRFAREAHPKSCLIYNDYHVEKPKKYASIIEKLDAVQKKGVKVDGVGIQCHIKVDQNSPSLKDLETAIVALSQSGYRVHITELDIDVLPNAWEHKGRHVNELTDKNELNPYTNALPPSISQQLSERYRSVFELFIKHRDKIDRVSFWGTTDDESWKNGLPIAGRTSYPLLFDRKKQPKPAYFAVKNLRAAPTP